MAIYKVLEKPKTNNLAPAWERREKTDSLLRMGGRKKKIGFQRGESTVLGPFSHIERLSFGGAHTPS